MGIFLLITLALGVILILISLEKDNDFMAIAGGSLLLFSAIGLAIYSVEPSAMDVYRGKTTLEITHKDGVAIDSTVVFK